MGLERLATLLRKYLMIVGGVALLGLVLLATGNVAFRIVGAPYSGTYEIVSFLGAAVTAAALGFTQKRKDHIVVDILSDRFPAPAKRLLDAVNYAVTALFFSVVSWQVFAWGNRLRQSGELSETLKVVYYPYAWFVATGFAALALTLALDLLETVWRKNGAPK